MIHHAGRYCKKIRGRVRYFGSGKQTALQRYFEDVSYLHTGRFDRALCDKFHSKELSVKILCKALGTAFGCCKIAVLHLSAINLVEISITIGIIARNLGRLLLGCHGWVL
jgi:hypothetical protein